MTYIRVHTHAKLLGTHVRARDLKEIGPQVVRGECLGWVVPSAVECGKALHAGQFFGAATFLAVFAEDVLQYSFSLAPFYLES